MQMGGGPPGFSDHNEFSAFDRAQRRAQNGFSPQPHHQQPWMGSQPPPQRMPPGYGQPPHGMPRMDGFSPGFGVGRQSPYDTPWMGRPPSGYGQPSQQGMPGMRPPPRPSGLPQGLEQAWVLLFNAGEENEDVCVDQSGRSPSVLAFERAQDADEFARILKAQGLDLAKSVEWEAEKIKSFCRQSGMEVIFVPRGQLPMPAGNNNQGGDPERMYPGDGTGRPDVYNKDRPKLEELLGRIPDNCGDDDCTIAEEAPADPDAATPEGHLRPRAIAAIDAMLTANNATIDLPTLMKMAWEKVKEDKQE
jgi:hypothetical protein